MRRGSLPGPAPGECDGATTQGHLSAEAVKNKPGSLGAWRSHETGLFDCGVAYIMLRVNEAYCDVAITSTAQTTWHHPRSTLGLWPQELNDGCVHLIRICRIVIYRAKKHAQALRYSGSASDSDIAGSFLPEKKRRQYQGLSSWHMTSQDKYRLLSSKLESQQLVLGYSFLLPECSQASSRNASTPQLSRRTLER